RQRQDGRWQGDEETVQERVTHARAVDHRAVAVQRPVPVDQRVPPTGRRDVALLAERGDGEAESWNEPDEGDCDQCDVERRPGGEPGDALCTSRSRDRNRTVDRRHQVITRSLRNRRTFKIITGSVNTSIRT